MCFQDRFTPWGVREEICLIFEDLRKGCLSVIEYQAQFCELSIHDITNFLNEAGRDHMFVRGLNFTIMYYMFRVVRKGVSLQLIMGTYKEVEFMVRENFRDLKSGQTFRGSYGSS